MPLEASGSLKAATWGSNVSDENAAFGRARVYTRARDQERHGNLHAYACQHNMYQVQLLLLTWLVLGAPQTGAS